jgi:hypothetical protein
LAAATVLPHFRAESVSAGRTIACWMTYPACDRAAGANAFGSEMPVAIDPEQAMNISHSPYPLGSAILHDGRLIEGPFTAEEFV